ncbi:uncharacterized protein PHACADRAFT_255117 [Phanerochaete carnosa HHB-10118-sp]|uniref:Uncharacterized protein n=1 Tax=Phanerochaete carnosa (strain HHB-10118-sp) TaxID=650164 RepID=K5X3L9_PHACS|nr:uncharacterized protein PHACADRAFT_255117 [Phanerochaete carnosa HHB-10118-sp]EKM57392.1 hypothetical protein PHACADRAFT_255117 [Phanerochaete carnosa HHB-10118-sp]
MAVVLLAYRLRRCFNNRRALARRRRLRHLADLTSEPAPRVASTVDVRCDSRISSQASLIMPTQETSVISANAFTVDYPSTAGSSTTTYSTSKPPPLSGLAHSEIAPMPASEVWLVEDGNHGIVHAAPPASSREEVGRDNPHPNDASYHAAAHEVGDDTGSHSSAFCGDLKRDPGAWKQDISRIDSEGGQRPRRLMGRKKPQGLSILITDIATVGGRTAVP